ncbi:MAG: DUF2935 domain-containing protein [Oscillibacter sp.]|nr:DUF2935 domain-containing protein [Oscillibacter sp.]
MVQISRYSLQSLELHLFFARIMKEHALFLTAAFPPANADLARRSLVFMEGFEGLLCQAAELADGAVSREVLSSGEVVTPFTLRAEQQTQRFTGLPINQKITVLEERLRWGDAEDSPALRARVHALNQNALGLLNGLIALKEQILSNVLSCRMFTMNYPLLIEHILREARLYREYLVQLESRCGLDREAMCRTERFWNQIMMEHALFIRGLLDPTENELIEAADGFAKDFRELLTVCRSAQDRTLSPSSLEKTRALRDFKAAGAQGIQECQIRSVILPLLADHVLREANHYIRLLES